MIEEETQSKLLAQVPTPRTDAWLKFTFATSDIMRAAPMACQNFADFARELERDNMILREALKYIEGRLPAHDTKSIAQARVALANKKL